MLQRKNDRTYLRMVSSVKFCVKKIIFEIKLPTEEEVTKRLQLARVVNSLGGVKVTEKYQKIINLYAKGDTPKRRPSCSVPR